MNQWLADHNITDRVDHRRAAEQGDPTPPERDVSKRSWEAHKRAPDSAAAAPVAEILAARQTRRQLRAATATATKAAAVVQVLGTEWQGRQPGLRGPGKRKKPGQPFEWDQAWSPPISGHVTAVEIGQRYTTILLRDGSAVLDTGTRLNFRGRVDDKSIAALADQAARHGWQQVELTGSPVFRDQLAAALAVRGITAINAVPSKSAIRSAEKQLAANTPKLATPQPVVAPPPRSTPAPTPAPPPEPGYRPEFKPPWASGPRRPTDDRDKRT